VNTRDSLVTTIVEVAIHPVLPTPAPIFREFLPFPLTNPPIYVIIEEYTKLKEYIIRYRPSAGRLIVELFYGNDHITREDGVITVNISLMARKLHVRPIRLCESLEWMQRYGIINDLTLGRKYATMNITKPEWARSEHGT